MRHSDESRWGGTKVKHPKVTVVCQSFVVILFTSIWLWKKKDLLALAKSPQLNKGREKVQQFQNLFFF